MLRNLIQLPKNNRIFQFQNIMSENLEKMRFSTLRNKPDKTKPGQIREAKFLKLAAILIITSFFINYMNTNYFLFSVNIQANYQSSVLGILSFGYDIGRKNR